MEKNILRFFHGSRNRDSLEITIYCFHNQIVNFITEALLPFLFLLVLWNFLFTFTVLKCLNFPNVFLWRFIKQVCSEIWIFVKQNVMERVIKCSTFWVKWSGNTVKLHIFTFITLWSRSKIIFEWWKGRSFLVFSRV